MAGEGNFNILFEVGNTYTRIYNAPETILRVFDAECRYPTQIAHAKDTGWAPPELADSNWDGWIRLLRIPKTKPPYVPTGLLSILTRICGKMKYQFQTIDARDRPEPGFPEMGAVPLRKYQTQAVDAAVKEGRGVLDMPPRAGKTRTMCEIHRQIALPTLWIAPTDRIVRQTRDVIEGFFGKNYVYHLVGSKEQEKAGGYHVVVCTAATAARLDEAFFQTRHMLVVDEWHHAAAKSYQHFWKACDHIYYRYGMTGTHFRSGGDDLAMHALLSGTIFKITSKELLDMGHLVPTDVVFLPMLTKKLRGLPKTFQTGHGKHGIHEHDVRNQMAAYSATYLYQSGKTVLMLVGTKKQGKTLQKMLTTLLPEAPDGARFQTCEFVSTDTDRKVLGEILESFLAKREVQILIGTSLLGEGVDLPTADALVYAKGEKAEVSLTQNAYRVCTKIEGKDRAIIVDFADRHHRKLLEHSHERLRVYYAESIFDVHILKDPNEFVHWLRRKAA